VLFVMEDLHWVDPSTLEFLNLLVDQGPTARILALLTFRPTSVHPGRGARTSCR
jgi:predicted ATPase